MARSRLNSQRSHGILPRLRNWIHTHRRLCIALLLCAATATSVQALIPPPVQTKDVIVASESLTAGIVLEESHLRVEKVAGSLVPEGAVANAEAMVGKRLATSIAPGGVITETNVVGPGFLEGLGAGIVAVPLTPANPKILPLLREGAKVDIYRLQEGGTPDADTAVLTASGATVLWIESTPPSGVLSTQEEPGMVVLAVKDTESAAVSALSLAAQVQLVLTH